MNDGKRMWKSALVAIAKNEDGYVEEWLSYYDKLGVSSCFLFLDDWKCDLTGLKLNNMVLYLIETKDIERDLVLNDESDVPDKFYRKQLACYNYWISKHKTACDFDFAMFFDIDEFLVVPEMDLQTFFGKAKNFEAVGINWKFFGDNGLSFDGKTFSVLQRFTKASKTLFRNGKPCLNLNVAKNKNYYFKTTMHSIYGLEHANIFDIVKNGYKRPKGWVYTAEKKLLTDEKIGLYLCHFRNKTKEECLKKCALHEKHQKNYMSMFEENFVNFNCNEVDDFAAKNFFYEL